MAPVGEALGLLRSGGLERMVTTWPGRSLKRISLRSDVTEQGLRRRAAEARTAEAQRRYEEAGDGWSTMRTAWMS